MRYGVPCLRPVLAALVLLGAAIAARSEPRAHITQCFACHGEDGIAKDRDVPHLAGQQEAYLVTQMRAFKSGKRAHKEMRVMSRDMTDTEIRDIAAFFAGLPSR